MAMRAKFVSSERNIAVLGRGGMLTIAVVVYLLV